MWWTYFSTNLLWLWANNLTCLNFSFTILNKLKKWRRSFQLQKFGFYGELDSSSVYPGWAEGEIFQQWSTEGFQKLLKWPKQVAQDEKEEEEDHEGLYDRKSVAQIWEGTSHKSECTSMEVQICRSPEVSACLTLTKGIVANVNRVVAEGKRMIMEKWLWKEMWRKGRKDTGKRNKRRGEVTEGKFKRMPLTMIFLKYLLSWFWACTSSGHSLHPAGSLQFLSN